MDGSLCVLILSLTDLRLRYIDRTTSNAHPERVEKVGGPSSPRISHASVHSVDVLHGLDRAFTHRVPIKPSG